MEREEEPRSVTAVLMAVPLPATVSCVLRGELFKAGESNPSLFKLRWFELFSDGTLQWAEQEGMPAKFAISVVDAHIALEPS